MDGMGKKIGVFFCSFLAEKYRREAPLRNHHWDLEKKTQKSFWGFPKKMVHNNYWFST